MALIQTSLIWVTYAVAIAILLVIASIFVYTYQAPRDRAASVTILCIFTVTTLLATLLLLPVDVALVSSTVHSKDGTRKDWATQDKVDSIRLTLKIVYYSLYSLDALLCLLVIPFTYFLYEEFDEREAEEGEQTTGSRLWGAFKYTLIFLLIVIILFVVGFFAPVARFDGKHKDLNYLKDLLVENRKHSILFRYCQDCLSQLPRPLREPSISSIPPFFKSCLTSRSRRRTCPNVCPWLAHHHRDSCICHLHRSWTRFVAGVFNQVRACHLCSGLGPEYRVRTRTKSRTATTA